MPAGDFTSVFGLGITGPGMDLRANAVAEDSAGNIVVVGSVQGTANFATGSTVSNLSSGGNRDTFVAKYSGAGTLLWAETFQGQSPMSVGQGSAVAIDGWGNIFVAGSFSGSVGFGTGGGRTILSAPSRTDAYAVKLDTSGTVIWATSTPGTTGSYDAAYALAIDGSGGVDIAGTYQGAATFGATVLTSGGASDAFAAHLDSAGRFTWACSTVGSGTSTAEVHGLTVDAGGRLVMAGFYAGSVDFNPGAGTTSLTSSSGSRDAAVWVLDASGNLAWARGYGGSDIDQADAVTVDRTGNVYVTGSYSGSVSFNSGPYVVRLTASGLYDSFVLKLASNGSLAWAAGFNGSTGAARGEGIAIDPSGNVVVAGWFGGTVDYNPGPSNMLLASAGAEDVYVAVLDSFGNYFSSYRAGGAGSDMACGLAVNGSGTVVTVGSYTGPAGFGATTLPAIGSTSVFVATMASASTPPPTPPAPRLEAASDTGSSSSDGITSSTSPVFDLSSTSPGLTVQLLRDGVVVAWRSGSGPLADPGAVSEGPHLYTTNQVNFSGIVGPSSPALSVTILTTPPTTSTPPSLLAADDSGIPGDGITNINPPRLVGTTAHNATVQILDPLGWVVAAGTSTGSGSYVISLPAPLADGTYHFAARAIDIAGNVGAAGPMASLTIDTTPPAAPSALTLFSADDSGVIGDKITNVTTPHLTGTAEPGATVQLVGAGGSIVGTAFASANGGFSVAVLSPLADGPIMLQARAIDAAGNVGPLGPSFRFVIDTTPPKTPAVLALLSSDDTGTPGDHITIIRTPRFVGTTEAGAVVQLLGVGGIVLATTVADASGAYLVQPSSPLAFGADPLSVVSTDAAGNRSAASPSLVLTILPIPLPPSTPTLLAADDSGAVGDGLTNANTPHLVGIAPVNSTVQLVGGGGQTIGTGTVGPDGTYSIVPTALLADGTLTLTAVEIDIGGNLSQPSGAFALTVDTIAPAVTSALSLVAADDSGMLGDGITNVKAPRLTGAAEPGSTVQLVLSGTVIATVVASPNGVFTVKSPALLFDGSYTFFSRAIDAAGNVGPTGPGLGVSILTTTPAPPSAPTLLAVDDSGTVGDRVTNVAQPRLVGTVTPGVTVRLLGKNGVTLGTTGVLGTNLYTVAPASPLPDGAIPLSVVAVDAAGNVSAASPGLTLTILTRTPATPTSLAILAADDSGLLGDGITNVTQPKLTGKAQPYSAMTLLDASQHAVGMATAGGDGSFSVKPSSPLPEGTYLLHARSTDAAGNSGSDGPSFTLTIVTTAPPAPSVGLLSTDDSGVKGDGITQVRSPRLTGSARPGGLVQLLDATANVVGSATASMVDGSYILTAPAASAGMFTYRVRATDVAGNVGPASSVLSIRILAVAGDFDGDGKADVATYNPSTALWSIRSSSTGAVSTFGFGWTGLDVPVAADYEGTGKDDLAVFRPNSADWYLLNPAGGSVRHFQLGQGGDIPVPGDYDGIGQAELAVYRPSTGQWLILNPKTNAVRTVTFGKPGIDQPVPADYDGAGRLQLATFNPGLANWSILHVDGTTTLKQFGPSGDLPVPADFDGDGKADLAVYHPATAQWFVLQSSNGVTTATQSGQVGVDQPVPANYDGVGKVNFANYRSPISSFYIRSTIDGSRTVLPLGTPNTSQAVFTPLAFRLKGVKLLPVNQNAVLSTS